MKYITSLVLVIIMILFFIGCSPNKVPSMQSSFRPDKTTPKIKENITENKDLPPDGKGVLNMTVMVHLEGWQDDKPEVFKKHADLLIELADLFEKYGAKLTLESKEFTQGCILFDRNVLKELEDRGHGIGVHADIGGNRKTTQKELEEGILEMKKELESLGVSVRHVSGISSTKDWVTAALNAGYEACTGIVSYGLWSLSEDLRPEGFEPYENPGEGHAAYPWELIDTIHPWRAESGSNWIIPSDSGLILIPSGGGLTFIYEENEGTGNGAGEYAFTDEDIIAWRNQIDAILPLTDSRQVNTYYAAWSFGSPPDLIMMEKWLRLMDEYVKEGSMVWTTVPEMIDLYKQWEK